MTWHGQINRTIWEIEHLVEESPRNFKLRREFLRTHFLQRYEYDRSLHIPRDDRSFLFLQDKQAPACLLLHGAHGTPAELRDLGNFLYGKGYTLYCPRLSRFDLKNRMVSWESWVTMAESAYTALLRYSKNTVIIGFSMGGVIGMILERLHPTTGMILLAPAVYPRLGIKGRLYWLARHITPALFYRFSGWTGEITKAMEHLRRSMGPIDPPTLVIQSKDDHVISPRGVRYLRRFVQNGNSDVVLMTHGGHSLARGPAKDEVFNRALGFLQSLDLGQRDSDSTGSQGRESADPRRRTGTGQRRREGRRTRGGRRGSSGRRDSSQQDDPRRGGQRRDGPRRPRRGALNRGRKNPGAGEGPSSRRAPAQRKGDRGDDSPPGANSGEGQSD